MSSRIRRARLGTTTRRAENHPTAIDLFSGCGGLSLGLKKAGFKVLAAIELDEKAVETYRLNHSDVKILDQDIRQVAEIKLMHDLGLKEGELDLLAGCPPCQGFSRMRKRNKVRSAQDERNGLIKDFVRFVRAFRPRTLMLENVPGLASHYRFKWFCAELKALGYLGHFEVLDAAAYGVPQRRQRLIYVAARGILPKMAVPTRTQMTVRKAISALPVPGESRDALQNLVSEHSEKVKQIIAAIPKDGGSRCQLPSGLVLECHRSVNGFTDVYGRMKWDDVSPTITGGCFNPSKGRFLHPAQNRAITLREAAVLQGFPRRYKFLTHHGRDAIGLMIGNALPPPFIAAHAKELAKTARQVAAHTSRRT